MAKIAVPSRKDGCRSLSTPSAPAFLEVSQQSCRTAPPLTLGPANTSSSLLERSRRYCLKPPVSPVRVPLSLWKPPEKASRSGQWLEPWRRANCTSLQELHTSRRECSPEDVHEIPSSPAA